MAVRPLSLLAAALLLGSCSSYLPVSARFVDGHVTFVAADGNPVECVRVLAIVDLATDETMWEIGGDGDDSCQGVLPIRYGARAPVVRTPAKPLRVGRRYDIAGNAGPGRGFDGGFTLTRETVLRLHDLS